jgi:hypothetical protein
VGTGERVGRREIGVAVAAATVGVTVLVGVGVSTGIVSTKAQFDKKKSETPKTNNFNRGELFIFDLASSVFATSLSLFYYKNRQKLH